MSGPNIQKRCEDITAAELRSLVDAAAARLGLSPDQRAEAHQFSPQFLELIRELLSLVDAVADFHGFNPQQRAETKEIALSDPGNSFECFRAQVAKLAKPADKRVGADSFLDQQ